MEEIRGHSRGEPEETFELNVQGISEGKVRDMPMVEPGGMPRGKDLKRIKVSGTLEGGHRDCPLWRHKACLGIRRKTNIRVRDIGQSHGGGVCHSQGGGNGMCYNQGLGHDRVGGMSHTRGGGARGQGGCEVLLSEDWTTHQVVAYGNIIVGQRGCSRRG
ncbi:hypothetical protein Salat_1168700, partial [Sesamum alatum]